jgi:hypothetical protein
MRQYLIAGTTINPKSTLSDAVPVKKPLPNTGIFLCKTMKMVEGMDIDGHRNEE